MDGITHNVVIGYTPPNLRHSSRELEIWIDPTYIPRHAYAQRGRQL